MPRIIDTHLTDALASGSGVPYLKAYIGYADGSILHSQPALSYKLTGTSLEFEVATTIDITADQSCIWLERGVTVAGVTYTLTTGRFYIAQQIYSPGRTISRGTLFPKQYYSAAGYDTYQNVITAFCAAYGKTAVFRNPADAWLAYKFFPVGKSIILNDANSFLNLLAQKYLIFACDNGSEEILFYSCAGTLTVAADETITAVNQLTKTLNHIRSRQYVWRDELETVHTAGAATDPIHDLGYLESTASAPARTSLSQLSQAIIRPDLRILDGDIVTVTALGSSMKVFAQVTEEYAPPASGHGAPRWQLTVAANEVFGNTAGGAMPSTIERVSNYTPLNTSMFNGVLTAAMNNLQACMDRLDDHQHQQFGGYGKRVTIPAGATQTITPNVDGLNTSSFNYVSTVAGTLKNLYFSITGTQPVTGTLVCTLIVNGVASAVQVVVPAGATGGTRSDLTNSVHINAGEYFRIDITNNAGAASAAIGTAVVSLT